MEYWQTVKALEEEVYGIDFVDASERGLKTASGDVVWPPHTHFHPSRAVLNERIVEELRVGKSLLSIGAGPAHMERLLTYRLGVDPENIVLADRYPYPEHEGFESHLFDMFGEWPQFGKRFDYIIFPHSVMLAERVPSEAIRRERLCHILGQASDACSSHGQVRINGHGCASIHLLKGRLERSQIDLRAYVRGDLITARRGDIL